MNHDHAQHDPQPRPFWGSRYSVGLLGFGAIALYFLLSEHRAHILGVLPVLFLLACPLMHVFMHRGHGGGHARGDAGKRDANTPVEPRSRDDGGQP